MESPKILFEVGDDLNTSAIAVGDVTGSGLAELCTGGRDGVLRLYDANQAEIGLLAQQVLEGSILSIRIADANNDGQMEIVVGRSIGGSEVAGVAGTLQIYSYLMSGQLKLLAEYPVDRFVTSVHVTDVTGDQKNEILAGGSDSTLRIFKMDTQNNLTEFVQHKLEDMPITIGTCDAIGDEMEEIVTGNRDKTLRVFKVRNSSVDEIQVLELPSPVISIAAGDVLGDRKMELGVVTHDGSVRIYRNEESRLELFSKLDDVKALSVRMAEINADHMDEVIIATSDQRIIYYNMYMADLKQIAEVNVGSKILSISVGDAGGDDRKEVLVGLSNAPLKIVQGLYQVIPKFEVSQEARTGTDLKATITLLNVTDQPVNGITGKIYWFPKDHMDVNPSQLRFELGPNEMKSIEVELKPKTEGTVIIRPIVMMWTDTLGNVKQVTTPETAILVEEGTTTAAPSDIAPVTIREEPVETELYEPESPLFAPVKDVVAEPAPVVVTEPVVTESDADITASQESLKEAEELLDKLFGTEEATSDVPSVSSSITELEPVIEPVVETPEPVVTSDIPVEVESAMVTEIRMRPMKPTRADLSEDAYMYLFKVMVTGEGAVGKTTLVNRYVTGIFERDYKTTIGSQFAVKLTHISPPESENSVGIKLQAWDVAGQARFQAVRKMYYSGAAGVVLVFDVTRRRSFTELVKWVQEAHESIGSKVPILCVGNKIDLPDRAVPSDEAKQWAEGLGFLYMESSAKTGEGVADMFTVLAELMWREARKTMESKKRGI
ncbi:MAG: GTP-binding protein [Candidatus Thorarchaeota archaeon]